MKWTWSFARSLIRFSILSCSLTDSSWSCNCGASGSTFSFMLSLLRLRVFGEASSSPSLDSGRGIAPSIFVLATSSSFRLVLNVSRSCSTILLWCFSFSNSFSDSTSWYWAAKVSCSFVLTFRLCTSTSSLINVYLFLADFNSSCSFTSALDDLKASFLALRTSLSYMVCAWACISLDRCSSSCRLDQRNPFLMVDGSYHNTFHSLADPSFSCSTFFHILS